MPICHIVTTYLFPNIEQLQSLANHILDTTLEGLSIPDPNDRETRITKANPDIESSNKIMVKFTEGDADADIYGYIDVHGEFIPSEETIKKVIENIRSMYGQEFNLDKFEIEFCAYRNSEFKMVEDHEVIEEISQSITESPEEGSSELVLTVSPKKYEQLCGNSSGKELSSNQESETVLQITQEKIKTTLLENGINVNQMRIIVAEAADAPCAVDFTTERKLPETKLRAVSEISNILIDAELGSNTETEQYSTVWLISTAPENQRIIRG